MAYLGVTWDHPSGVALLRAGEISAAVSEERYSRKKNDGAFPKDSFDYCLSQMGNEPLDFVGVTSLEPSYSHLLLQSHRFTVGDMVEEQHRYWYPRIFEDSEVSIIEALPDKCLHEQFPSDYWKEFDPQKETTFPEDSRQIIGDYLDIETEKVIRIEHHTCHALYAYYASPFRDEKALVLTVDGSGDGLNATASIAENGKLTRIYQTDKCILGRIYSHVTLALGMKRLEHEYKVMGLAPYGNLDDSQGVYDILNSYIDVDGIEFVWKQKPKDSYFTPKKQLEGYRFDLVAAGMQRWVEDILSKWVSNLIQDTGITTLVLSGGVSMNVKAMGVLSRIPSVTRLYVPGSGADETTCIGAAIGASVRANGGSLKKPVTMQSMYLGSNPDCPKEELRLKVESLSGLSVIEGPSSSDIAQLLVDGLVIGRCVGRMEFGQRSLGNRAILADPTVPDLVAKINHMIKHRDFWMPFAPVLLDKFVDRYLINPKNIESPHMTIAFHTSDEGYECMRAACHPADRTARAQILRRSDNPEMYQLMLDFERLTGRGALLNTSFNLHGWPIVRTEVEAVDVFLGTGLEALWLSDLLIVKTADFEAVV